MKKVLILMILAFTFACSSDDDNSKNIEEYKVTRYQSGALNVDTFGDNDIIWSFNFSNNTLTVENNVFAMYQGTIPSGTYDFSFENNVLEIDYSTLNYAADFNLSEDVTVLTLFFDLIPEAIDDEILYVFESL